MLNTMPEEMFDRMMRDQHYSNSPDCQCSSCTDKKEIQELKDKIYCLEKQIEVLERIVDSHRKYVRVVVSDEEIKHLARIDAE